MIIGITGLLGSGKDTAAQVLQKKGFEHFSTGDEVRYELRMRGMAETRENLQQVANELREKLGAEELARRAFNRCKKKNCVISGLRNLGEVTFLKKQPDFELWEIWTPVKMRYERIIARGKESEKNTTSLAKFLEQEDRELAGSSVQQNLKAVIALADKRIKNYQDQKILERRIDEAVKKLSAAELG